MLTEHRRGGGAGSSRRILVRVVVFLAVLVAGAYLAVVYSIGDGYSSSYYFAQLTETRRGKGGDGGGDTTSRNEEAGGRQQQGAAGGTRRSPAPGGGGGAAGGPAAAAATPPQQRTTAAAIRSSSPSSSSVQRDGAKADKAAAAALRSRCSCRYDNGGGIGGGGGGAPSTPTHYCCCQRKMLVEHKMGVIATGGMWREYNRTVTRGVVAATSTTATADADAGGDGGRDFGDYRQAVVVRDFYDAIVSGYLYHRSGRECWLDPFGRPWEEDRPGHHQNWATKFRFDPGPYPPKDGRNLCRYLADESDEAGMWAYMNVAMRGFYRSLYPLYARYSRQPNNTVFVCYDKLTNPETSADTLNGLHRFMFPGDPGGLYRGPALGGTLGRGGDNATSSSGGEDDDFGGHATSKNATLRSRLRDLIRKLDAERFGNMVAEKQEAIYLDAGRCSG